MKPIQYTRLQAFAHNGKQFKVQGDTHVFVLASTGEKYSNCGGIYEDDIYPVADGLAYHAWLKEFYAADTPSDKTFETIGISFCQNGVCHTFAARELLTCINDKNVFAAGGDDMCLLYFGKYGCGLEFLKKRLCDSFAAAKRVDDIPDEALERALARVDNTLDDEVEAWIIALEKHMGMKVTAMFQDPDDWFYLRERVKRIAQKREELFLKYFQTGDKATLNEKTFRNAKDEMYIKEFTEYMSDLVLYGYLSEEDARAYSNAFKGMITEASDAYEEAYRRVMG